MLLVPGFAPDGAAGPTVPLAKRPASPPPVPAAASQNLLIDYQSPAPARLRGDVYLSFPGDEIIGRYTVVGSIILYVAVLAAALFGGVNEILVMGQLRGESANVQAAAIGLMIGMLSGFFVVLPALLAGVCVLGVWIASKLIGFKNRPGLIWKAAAVVCAPVAVTVAMHGFQIDSPEQCLPPLWVAAVVLPVMLWLVLRMRPWEFTVTAVIVMALYIGPPAVIWAVLVQFPARMPPNITVTRALSPPAPVFTWSSAGAVAPGSAFISPTGPPNFPPVFPPTGPPGSAFRYAPTAITASDETRDRAELQRIGEAIKTFIDSDPGKALPHRIEELVERGLLKQSEINDTNGVTRFSIEAIGTGPPFNADSILANGPLTQAGPTPAYLVLFGDGRIEWVRLGEYARLRMNSMHAAHRHFMPTGFGMPLPPQ